jgi:hypothetical protein
MATKKATNDLKVLVPETVTWEISGQTFEQAPATLDRLADIMDVIVDEVLASGKGELLDKLMDTATAVGGDEKAEKGVADAAKSVIADREMLTSFVRIIATLPRSMPRIVAAILGAPEDFLRANLRPKEAFSVLRVFVQQNDVGSIVRDFFDLFNELKANLTTDETASP